MSSKSTYQDKGDRVRPKDFQPSREDIRRIIVNDEAAKLLVEKAQAFGVALATASDKEEKLETSQIRTLFSAVRLIEMNWIESEDAVGTPAERSLILLKPKLAYQAQRNKALKPLAEVLSEAIDAVQGNRVRFQRLVEFFEAILAYHKSAGGK